MTRRAFGAVLTLITLLAAMAAGTVATVAQESTPVTGSAVAYPAGIRSGTCEEPGDVAFNLGLVSSEALGATPHVDIDDPAHGNVIARGQATIETSLGELLDEEHAVTLQRVEDGGDNYLICGNIEGDVEEGTVIIELMEVDESGVTGQAILAGNDDGTVDVTITLLDAEGQEGATRPLNGRE